MESVFPSGTLFILPGNLMMIQSPQSPMWNWTVYWEWSLPSIWA